MLCLIEGIIIVMQVTIVARFLCPSCSLWTSFARHFANRPPVQHSMNVFDRRTKFRQKYRASCDPEGQTYDYVKDEFGYRLIDRVFDIKRVFPVAIDLHCGRGHVSKHLTDDIVDSLILCDTSSVSLSQAVLPEGKIRVEKVQLDDEKLPFRQETADIIFSSLGLHWINNLPAALFQILLSLKSDGVFIGSMFGGETLYELRCSLQLAETEREGGFSPHVSPFAQPQDIGSLLHGVGFNMITIDSDEICVNYPSMFELMFDLQGMGESNASWNRRNHLSRDTMLAAAAIYKQMYGNPEDGSIRATFQVFSFIGWKPHESQPIPEKRGSATFSLKDISDLDKITVKKDDQSKL